MSEKPPWQDRETLERLYLEEGLTTREIADRLGCGKSTASKWVNKFDIETRQQGPEPEYPTLRDEDELKRLYHDEGLSQPEIAEKLGCYDTTVSKWFRKHGIETDDREYTRRMEARRVNRASFGLDTGGYEAWKAGRDSYRVHRLLAVAEYGVDAVVGKDVHHKNHIPWDNRPENIELLTPAEHGDIHGVSRFDGGDEADV